MQGESNQADDQSPQTLHFLFQEAIDSKTNIIHMADRQRSDKILVKKDNFQVVS